jgi:hypothetical protein
MTTGKPPDPTPDSGGFNGVRQFLSDHGVCILLILAAFALGLFVGYVVF